MSWSNDFVRLSVKPTHLKRGDRIPELEYPGQDFLPPDLDEQHFVDDVGKLGVVHQCIAHFLIQTLLSLRWQRNVVLFVVTYVLRTSI